MRPFNPFDLYKKFIIKHVTSAKDDSMIMVFLDSNHYFLLR